AGRVIGKGRRHDLFKAPAESIRCHWPVSAVPITHGIDQKPCRVDQGDPLAVVGQLALEVPDNVVDLTGRSEVLRVSSHDDELPWLENQVVLELEVDTRGKGIILQVDGLRAVVPQLYELLLRIVVIRRVVMNLVDGDPGRRNGRGWALGEVVGGQR